MKLLVATDVLVFCSLISLSHQQLNCLGQADIVAILDESQSVGLQNYYVMKNFTLDLINGFSAAISGGWIQFSLMSYGTGPRDRFYLNHTSDPNVMNQVISSMTYLNQSTFTHAALFNTYNVYLKPQNGRRPDVPAIVILLTDGISHNAGATSNQAGVLKDMPYNATIFAIGIQNASVAELNDISSDPDSKFSHFVSNFASLNNIKDLIINETCSSIPDSAVIGGSIPVGTNLTQVVSGGGGGGGGSSGTGSSSSSSQAGGLTSSQKVGIGIGVPLALIAIATAVAMGVCCVKGGLVTKRKEEEKKAKDDMKTGDIGERAAERQTKGTVTPPV